MEYLSLLHVQEEEREVGMGGDSDDEADDANDHDVALQEAQSE